jgi:hypothetical protein
VVNTKAAMTCKCEVRSENYSILLIPLDSPRTPCIKSQ